MPSSEIDPGETRANRVAKTLAKLAGYARPAVRAAAETTRSPTACPFCDSDRACPMQWGAVDDTQWWIRLRCGDCGVWIEKLMSNDEAAALDVELDRQTDRIRRLADRLDAERMADQAKAFIAALHCDAVVAADF